MNSLLRSIVAIVSPSLGREWIEIVMIGVRNGSSRSPSLGREWIEMKCNPHTLNPLPSPSLGREWIEISARQDVFSLSARLPPWGGSGLKSHDVRSAVWIDVSPSLGRE